MERKPTESGSCLVTGRVNRVTATVLNAGRQGVSVPVVPTVCPLTAISGIGSVPQHPGQVLGRVLLKAVPRGSGGAGKKLGKGIYTQKCKYLRCIVVCGFEGTNKGSAK